MYVGYSESGGEYWSAPTGLGEAAAGLLRPAQSFTYLATPPRQSEISEKNWST